MRSIEFNGHDFSAYTTAEVLASGALSVEAEAFGAKGLLLADPADAPAVLAEAFAAEGPVLVDCRIGIDDKVLPMIAPGKSFEDIITKLD